MEVHVAVVELIGKTPLALVAKTEEELHQKMVDRFGENYEMDNVPLENDIGMFWFEKQVI